MYLHTIFNHLNSSTERSHMKSTKVSTTMRHLVLPGIIGFVFSTVPALSAETPRDAQAQMRDILLGTPQSYSPTQDEGSIKVEIQALVRRVILGTPGDGVALQKAAAVAATTERRGLADTQRQVQRTLQGGAG
jgi:hypothetical protein